MNEEEYNQMFEQTALAGQVGSQAQAAAAAQYYVQEQERSIADAQLECDKILDKVRHILKQDYKRYKEDGSFEWVSIDESKRVLTDLGVNRIIQTMECYVNKESLLSNYDEKIINRRMLEFSLALNANLFMKYEVYFRIPTIEESIEMIKERIQNKAKIKQFALNLLGINSDIKVIERKLIEELESRIEEEIEKVRKQKQRQNQSEYEMLFTEIRAIVESIHQRAFRGEERGSLRRHTNISEIIGGKPPQMERGGMFKWLRG